MARLRAWLRDTRDSFQFHLRRPDWSSVLSATLPFGDIAQSRFQELITQSQQYLEYGAGASTIYAAKLGVPLVTIESDESFLRAVEEKCTGPSRLDQRRPMTFIHGDIGATGPWGKPVLPFIARPRRWSNYPLAPWETFGPSFRADLILIDGRFRVACALAVVLKQPEGNWTLLVDDYLNRPEYQRIEEYADLVGMHGRMAEFVARSPVEASRISRALQTFSSDWR